MQHDQIAKNKEEDSVKEQVPKKEKKIKNLHKVIKKTKSWKKNPLFKVS